MALCLALAEVLNYQISMQTQFITRINFQKQIFLTIYVCLTLLTSLFEQISLANEKVTDIGRKN